MPVNLHSGHLKNIIGNSYGKTIESMVGAGILKQEKKYVIGHHSRSYLLTPDLYAEDWLFRSYAKTAGKLFERLIDWRNRDCRREKDSLRGTNYWGVVNDLGKVNVRDVDLAEIDFAAKVKFKKTAEGYQWRTIDPNNTRETAEMSLNKIRNGEMFFSKDQYGRLHTNITCLPNELMPLLTFNCGGGESLVSIDVRNSQPLFLYLLLNSIYSLLSFIHFPFPLPYTFPE